MCQAAPPGMRKLATDSAEKRQRVAIIGAGAAGMAAAWSLSRFPNNFEARASRLPMCARARIAASRERTRRWR